MSSSRGSGVSARRRGRQRKRPQPHISAALIPLYTPGQSLLHRCPAGLKMAGVAAVAGVVTWWREVPELVLSVWALVVVGYALVAPGVRGLRMLVSTLWRVKWLAVLIALPQLIFLTPEVTALTTARILAVILLAGLFTRTTRVSDVLNLVEALIRPLERVGAGRIGVTAERVGLAAALTLRSLPVVAGFYADIKAAHTARSVRAGPRNMISTSTTLMVMCLRHAEQTAEALTARGMR